MSESNAPLIRIIIVCYRSSSVLQACLDSLTAQTFENFDVIIVNNDKDDLGIKDIALPDQRFRLIEAEGNIGFAAASNLGAKNAKSNWLVTLNPDAFPAPDWLDTLMKAAEDFPDASSLSSALISYDNPEVSDGIGDCYSIFGLAWRGGQGQSISSDIRACGPVYVLSPCAAAAAYRRIDFESAGGFDEAFFCYLEDIDLGLRLFLRGKHCLHVPDAKVRHIGSHSTSGAEVNDQNAISLFYTYRNQIRLMVKIMPVPVLLLAAPAFAASKGWILLRILRQPHRGARLKGLITGLSQLPTHIKARKSIQQSRVISTREFSKRISWNPRHASRKTARIWENNDGE